MAIEKDFITEYGILIQGTNVVTSSTNQVRALQVNGGAAIAKNLIVGTDSTFHGPTTVHSDLTVNGQTNLNTLIVNSTSSNTGTNSANAVYIAGGVWIDKNLTVNGKAVFTDDVVFNGTSTFVYSTNTYLTDNIINLHTPDGNYDLPWTFDDGKDIGLRFQYFTNSTNTNAALVLANDTKWLEWYESGAEGTNTFTGGEYGTFKTGRIRLVSTESAISTTTGALSVAGGVSIAGDLFVGGTINAVITGVITTASNISGGTAGSLVYQVASGNTGFIGIGSQGSLLQSNGSTATFVSTSSLYVGNADNSVYATNINGGIPNQLVFQSSTGTTGFIGPGNQGQILVSGGSGSPPGYVNTGNIYVGNSLRSNLIQTIEQTTNANYYLTFVDSNNSPIAYESLYTTSSFTVNPSTGAVTLFSNSQSTSTTTGALVVAGGVGIGGNLYVSNLITALGTGTHSFSGPISISVVSSPTAAINLNNNDIININTLQFADPGGDGRIDWGSWKIWDSPQNFSNTTGNLQFVYNSAGAMGATGVAKVSITSATNSISTSTGALVVNGGAGIGLDLYVGGNTNITGNANISGITTITNTINAVSTTSGALQIVGGVGIGQDLYVGGTIYGTIIGSATTATNILGGTTGQIPYQTTSSVTSFFGPGISGQLLVSAGAAAPVYTNTSSIHVGTANVSFNSIKTNTVQQTNSASYYLTFVDSNNASATDESLYTSSTVYVIPSSGQLWATQLRQTSQEVAIGNSAGNSNQGASAVAIGQQSGQTDQGSSSVAIGNLAGRNTQSVYAVALGYASGNTTQGTNAIAIGRQAGQTDQGQNSIAIGYLAGQNTQTANSIVLNASGSAQNVSNAGFYVNPVRADASATSTIVFYNASTKELTTASATSITAGIANNLAGGAQGSIPYQNAANSTTFLTIGTNGFVLTSNGTVPTWQPLSGLSAGTAFTATNLAGGTTGQIPYQTTSGVTSFFGPGVAGQLLVSSGAAVPVYTNTSSIHVGTADTAFNSTQVNTVQQTSTQTHYLTFVDSNNSSATAENLYTTSSITINPGNGSIQINSTLQSSSTVANNALFVTGGVGIQGSLLVKGPAYFDNNVVFSGTSTYVYSTNTVYTDNLINLHVPAGSTGSNHSWAVDDGQDIGFVFHYYDSIDKDAGLVLANDTKYLEWYNNGSENLTNGTFTGTSYGIFKTGGIILTNTTTSISTTTGALQVAGGVGVGGSLYVGNRVGWTSSTNISAVYQYYNQATNSLDTVFG